MVRPSRVTAMFASRACRSSIMIGTALSRPEMRRVSDGTGRAGRQLTLSLSFSLYCFLSRFLSLSLFPLSLSHSHPSFLVQVLDHMSDMNQPWVNRSVFPYISSCSSAPASKCPLMQKIVHMHCLFICFC